MTPLDRISAALQALAAQDRDREAPQEVETRVLQAFRRRRAQRRLKPAAFLALAIAASIAFFFFRPQELPKPMVTAPQVAQTPVPVAAVPAPIQSKAQAKAPRARSAKRQPREVVTEFFPLLDVASPFERGELLRMMVPASTMREVGLPVNEDRLGDRVYADVLVGQEGLARAIRFVSYE